MRLPRCRGHKERAEPCQPPCDAMRGHSCSTGSVRLERDAVGGVLLVQRRQLLQRGRRAPLVHARLGQDGEPRLRRARRAPRLVLGALRRVLGVVPLHLRQRGRRRVRHRLAAPLVRPRLAPLGRALPRRPRARGRGAAAAPHRRGALRIHQRLRFRLRRVDAGELGQLRGRQLRELRAGQHVRAASAHVPGS